MSEESKSVYMPYYELVRISLDAAQRIGSEIELHHGGLIKLFKEIDALNARIAELKELLDTESQLSNQFYLLLVDNPKSKKLADDLIEALRINGKEVQE